LQSLSRHKHVDVTKSFALAMFDQGLIDGGRALFEELLTSYPKRSDLWNLLLDREVKMGHIVQSRALFERMISAKTSGKNIRTAFKKYLAFEQKGGDAARVEAVKAKAQAYVASVD
jgi:rRNA biogenesis protein RRP5